MNVLCLTLLFTFADSWSPASYLTQLGFVETDRFGSSTYRGRLFFSRPSDSAAVEVSYGYVETPAAKFGSNSGYGPYESTPMSKFDRFTASGLPLGTDVMILKTHSYLRTLARTNYEIAKVSVRLPSITGPDGYLRNGPGFTRDQLEEFEGILRTLLGHMVSHRLQSASTTSVAGSSCSTLRDQRSNHVYVRVSHWAAARDFAYRYNVEAGTIGLTKPGRTLILPLGATKFKDNSTWRDAFDGIALVDGQPYIRLNAVE